MRNEHGSKSGLFYFMSSVCLISIFEKANSFFPRSLREAPMKYTVLSITKKRSWKVFEVLITY